MALTPMVNVDPHQLAGHGVGESSGAPGLPLFTIRVLEEEIQQERVSVTRAGQSHQGVDRSNNVLVATPEQSNNVAAASTPHHQEQDSVSNLKKNNQYTTEKLELECEWSDCVDYYDHYGLFSNHVSSHIHEAEVRTVEHVEAPLDKVFGCLWADCGFETPDSEEMVRHINFHAFHTKIKCHGRNMLSQHGLTACSLDPGQRNIVPDQSEPWTCQWAGCEETCFDRPRDFYSHVSSHVDEIRGKGRLACRWGECCSQCNTVSKLKEHLRSHTQEKMIGCPNCGALFSNRVKFLDHCKRQQAAASEECFKCSNCNKKFAIERLLRDHMRSHINHYKCPHCDMTKPTPSTLERHIRYKHMDEKPFKCNFCEYAAKDPPDLNGHMKVHYEDMEYKCNEPGCNYKCRAEKTLKIHFLKKHKNTPVNNYACHLCDKRFNRGNNLTKHLMKEHQFSWPSGHSRFRYVRDELTGVYRLQTIRFESVDLQDQLAGGGDSLRIAEREGGDSDLDSVGSTPDHGNGEHYADQEQQWYPRTSSPVHSVHSVASGGWSSHRSHDTDTDHDTILSSILNSQEQNYTIVKIPSELQ